MKTGVIGLGAMGKPMALNLHKQGHLHAVWNRTREKAAELAASTGVICADTPQALAAESQETALEFLVDVLQLARPEGYLRTFVDAGASLVPLLQDGAGG